MSSQFQGIPYTHLAEIWSIEWYVEYIVVGQLYSRDREFLRACIKGVVLRTVHSTQDRMPCLTQNRALTWMISGARYSGVPHRVHVLVEKDGHDEQQ